MYVYGEGMYSVHVQVVFQRPKVSHVLIVVKGHSCSIVPRSRTTGSNVPRSRTLRGGVTDVTVVVLYHEVVRAVFAFVRAAVLEDGLLDTEVSRGVLVVHTGPRTRGRL